VTATPPRPPDADARPVDRARGRRGPAPLRALLDALDRAVTGVRNAWAGARSGQRPLLVALAVALILGVVMLSGPFERYADSRTRVEALRSTADTLEDENARLEQRVDHLQDPAELERLAREEQGMIRPGEVPYTLIPPEVDRPVISAPRASDAEDPTPPWYARAWDAVRSWF
jgi:cell division protein FtsB